MSVRREASTIHLEGVCPVEEAEVLTALLDTSQKWTVELSACRQIHTALLQVLLRYQPTVVGEPLDPFLSRLVVPALTRAEDPGHIPPETSIP
jgi:hypothetical protein